MNLNKNIVLIGMPGSGKTTIGEKISMKLSIEFIDIDHCIETITNTSIADLFKQGEEYFRFIESKTIRELFFDIPCIISTGGGTILSQSNMKILQKNAITFFIDRPINKILKNIDTAARPLLNDDSYALYNIYEKRYSLYKKYADYTIKNDGSILCVIDKILDIYISKV